MGTSESDLAQWKMPVHDGMLLRPRDVIVAAVETRVVMLPPPSPAPSAPGATEPLPTAAPAGLQPGDQSTSCDLCDRCGGSGWDPHITMSGPPVRCLKCFGFKRKFAST